MNKSSVYPDLGFRLVIEQRSGSWNGKEVMCSDYPNRCMQYPNLSSHGNLYVQMQLTLHNRMNG